MHKAVCPACSKSILINPKPKLGQRVVCPGCRAELEVVEIEPLELDWPFDDDYVDDDEDFADND